MQPKTILILQVISTWSAHPGPLRMGGMRSTVQLHRQPKNQTWNLEHSPGHPYVVHYFLMVLGPSTGLLQLIRPTTDHI